MATVINGVSETFTTSAAVAQYQQVTLVNVGGAAVVRPTLVNEPSIGMATHSAASGDTVGVLMLHPTQSMIAGAAVAIGAIVFAGALGRSNTANTGSTQRYIAKTAAAAAGEVFRVVPIV